MVFYDGDCADDAADVVDATQGRPSASSRAPSHVRGHAVASPRRRLPRDIDCVESFSWDCLKSVILSRSDQDKAVHTAPLSEAEESKMNSCSEYEQVKCYVRHLQIMMSNFRNDQRISYPIRIKYVVVGLRHSMDDGSMHIHTCYPIG